MLEVFQVGNGDAIFGFVNDDRGLICTRDTHPTREWYPSVFGFLVLVGDGL